MNIKELTEPGNTHIEDIKKFKEKANLNSSYGEATDPETSEADETTDTEVGKFVYDVVIHNFYGCNTYTVRADGLESAEDKALKRMENENDEEEYYSIDSIRIYKENSDELLKEIIFEPSEAELETATETEPSSERETSEISKPLEINNMKSAINSIYGITPNTSSEISNEYDEAKELLAVEQFERLTKTLYKSLFKAIGLEETRKIPFIISNNMVFFNYNGVQYKYYPSQCKIFKKCGRKYQRINWRDFADDNPPTDQKQAFGRSPPLLLI